MNWAKKHKLLANKAIQYNRQPCIKLDDLWQALHQIFNLVQKWQINSDIMNEIPTRNITIWTSFSVKEFRSSIVKCNNSSIPGLNKVSWKYLKAIVKDDMYLNNFVNIANICINLEHWPLHFKTLLSIIIPKPNKASYNSPKMFLPIILLNILSKLIEKVIGERFQF